MSNTVLEMLTAEYPQLYLNPDVDSQETYKQAALQGIEPADRSLAHYQGDPFDRLETEETPAGPVRAVTLGNRRDFELVIRNLTAAKSGPLTPVPQSQGASMLTMFNWPRIHAHLALFPESEKAEAFRRFTAVKANYIDILIVLSRGPYSHVNAVSMGCSERQWLQLSDTIRRFHELTHVICRRQYPGNVDAMRDELIADAVGLFAAYGRYDPEMERRFLSIQKDRYTGGRLGNYTDDPKALVPLVNAEISRIQQIIGSQKVKSPCDLIPVLMEHTGSLTIESE